MYRSGGEQARAEAQQKRKQERGHPQGLSVIAWAAEHLATGQPRTLPQATELLESINTSLDSLRSVVAKIELRTDTMARSSGQDRQDRSELSV